MLGKVLKYEMRSSARLLLPLFAIGLIVSAAARLMFFIAPKIWAPAGDFITGIASIASVLVVIGVALLGIAAVVMRFYQSMVSTEGYLSFTLPVTPNTHVAARTISGTIWGSLGVLVAIVCLFIFVPGLLAMDEEMAVMSSTVSLADIPFDIWASIIGLLLFFIVTSVLTSLMQFYASIAIGPSIIRNRLGGSVIAYILLNTIQGILMVPIMMLPLMNSFGLTNDEFARNFMGLMEADVFASVRNMMGVMWQFALFTVAIGLVFAAAQYLLSVFFFKKKLNLE